jgi:hypothetical protein|tara:strand:+ start:25736 stop:26956 length:1221 start_codon:yes stop_codon:yes gene_type:complete
VPRLLLKELIKTFIIFCAGIIPVLGASGLPGQPLWLKFAPGTSAAGAQAIAGISGDQQLLLSAVGSSDLSLSGFWGQGQGLSSLSPVFSFTNRDASLFHGEHQRPVRFAGAALDFFKGSVQFTTGVSQVESTGAPDRVSWFTGATSERFALQLFRVDGQDTVAAHAIGLQMRLPVGTLHTSYAVAAIDTASAVLRWQVPLSSKLYLGFELRDGRSTRFSDGTYQRWVLNIAGSTRGSGALLATEGGNNGAQIATTALLAAGAVGIALVATSGSDDTDSQLRFSTQHETARNVLNSVNPTSVAQNLEYGGWVYRNSDTTFSATEPVKGTVDRVNIGSPTSVPSGYATASYHTHGAYDPKYDSENFSYLDITMNNNWGVDGYLGTPAGYYKYHHYLTGVISTLGTIAN